MKPMFRERLRVILVDFALVDRRPEADRLDKEENLMKVTSEILKLVKEIVPEADCHCGLLGSYRQDILTNLGGDNEGSN